MTAKEQGLPELPPAEIKKGWPFITPASIQDFYTAEQMHKFREEGIAAALASDTGERGVVDGAVADLAAVMEVAAEASAVPLQWQASTDFTPEQCKDWLAEAVSENVKAGDFTGELHSIAEFESGLTVAFTGCGPKSAANAKFLIWCAHFILKHGDTVAAALRAQPAGGGEVRELAQRAASKVEALKNGESALRYHGRKVEANHIAHTVEIINDLTAALRAQPAGGGGARITVGAGVHATDLWLREVGIGGTLVYVPLDTSSEAVSALGAAINPRPALTQPQPVAPPESGGQGEARYVGMVHTSDLPAPLTDASRWPPNYADGWNDACKMMLVRPVAHPPAQASGAVTEFTDRQRRVVKFALSRFISDALHHANASAQKGGEWLYKPGAFEAFSKDADDAEQALAALAQGGGT